MQDLTRFAFQRPLPESDGYVAGSVPKEVHSLAV